MGVPMVHWLPDYRVFEGGGDGRESVNEKVDASSKKKKKMASGRSRTEKKPSERKGFQAVATSLGHLGRVMLDLLDTV